MRRTPALAVATAALAVVLTGCGLDEAVQDAASDAASNAVDDATCEVVRDSVSQVTGIAGNAADAIGVDPQAARDDLQTASDAIAIAQLATGGDLNADLIVAKTAIDVLLSEAAAAVAGDVVDSNVVNSAQDQLNGAIEDISGAC